MTDMVGYTDTSQDPHDAREGKLVHSVDLSAHGTVAQAAPEVIEGLMGIERQKTVVTIDGAYLHQTDPAVLPVREVYVDGGSPDRPQIGAFVYDYAKLPEGVLALERVRSDFDDGKRKGSQEIVRTFDLKTGRPLKEVMTVNGKRTAERTYGDPRDYEGGQMVTDQQYRADGSFERHVVYFQREGEPWQVHARTFDEHGEETVLPWTQSLSGPEALQAPPQPVSFVKSVKMDPAIRL